MTLKRHAIDISTKQEVVNWIAKDGNRVPSRAVKHFCSLGTQLDAGNLRKWWRQRDSILAAAPTQKRLKGGGRNPSIDGIEDLLLDEIIAKRLRKEKVTRRWICEMALSMRAHISKDIKAKCAARQIGMCVIPGGLTPYLQAGDLTIYKAFKDLMSIEIDVWKRSDQVQYTRGGNPKPPTVSVVCGWVKKAWRETPQETVESLVKAAGFSDDYRDWFITNHDVYGAKFKEQWCAQAE